MISCARSRVHKDMPLFWATFFPFCGRPTRIFGAFKGRIRVAVPRMGVGEAAATSLALIFHELATNSLKYGALSEDTGTLDLSGSTEDSEVY